MKTGSLYNSGLLSEFSGRSQNRSGFKNSSGGNLSDRDNTSIRSKRNRVRRTSNGSIKSMKPMTKKTKNMDFTNYTYREAVNRLKYLLAESYTPAKTYGKHLNEDSGDDTDNMSVGSKALDRPALSEISKYLSPSYRGIRTTASSFKKIKPYSPLLKESLTAPTYTTAADYLSTPQIPSTVADTVQAPPEILNFIEKQEDYIEQLEKESKFCRNELSNLLGKVKDVINENEALTEHARSDLVGIDDKLLSASSESDDNYEKFPRKKEKVTKYHLSGPNIVFESRISELEAELAQSSIDLKKVRTENDELKRKVAYSTKDPETTEVFRKQIENLQRDKTHLEDTIRRLEATINDLKTDSRFCTSKRQRDLADMALFEKSQSELEIKHLRDELERQHERVRELQHEMARRVAEERANAERRYNYQVDQLGGDLSSQWEQVSKLQMDLERQKRIEADLKRDLSQRNAQIDELKVELKAKRSSFLSDIAQVNAEKQSLEQEITTLRLQLERSDRQSKVEAARLGAEINSLRQRLDRADADVLHSKRDNLRLHDEIANLEKEVALGDMKNEVSPKRDINKAITEMQEKHDTTVNDLEEMIQSQKQLMDKLTNECKTLTNKLEDTSLKHKMEISALQSNVEFLTNKIINNDRDKMVKNDTYSNLATSKAPIDYDASPTSTANRPSNDEPREELSPVSRTLPFDFKGNALDTRNSRYESADITTTEEPYRSYNYGEDENKKDDFGEGTKTRKKPNDHQTVQPVQLPREITKPYDSETYNSQGGEEQYPLQIDPNYSSQYQENYGTGYDQQPYDATEYVGGYDQQYEGGDQQYADYEPGYEQMYQQDETFYNQQQQPSQLQHQQQLQQSQHQQQSQQHQLPQQHQQPQQPPSISSGRPTKPIPTTVPSTTTAAAPISAPVTNPASSIPPTSTPISSTPPTTGTIPTPVEGRNQSRTSSGSVGPTNPRSGGIGDRGPNVLSQPSAESYKGVPSIAKNQ